MSLSSSLTPSAVNYIKNLLKDDSVVIPASLFYRKEGYSVGDLKLDLILSEEHSLDSSVTEHPVQDGSVVSDHIYRMLRKGTLRALVSNWSIADTSTREDMDKADEEQIARKAEEVMKSGLPNRAKDAWTTLKAIQEAGEPVTITTSLEVYDNVLITHIDTSRDEDTGEALDVVIEFTEFKKVKLREDRVTASVAQQDMDSSINREASGRLYEGQVVAAPASPAEQSQLGGN